MTLSRIIGVIAACAGIALGAGAAQADFVARHGLTSAQYQAAFDQYAGEGYRLAQVDAYETGSGVRYAAIWNRAGGDAWVARHGLDANSYQSAFNQYNGEGYQLADVSATARGQGSGTFAAVWRKSGGAYAARHGLTSAQYQAAFDQYVGQGYKLVDVEGYTGSGGATLYAALWVQGTGTAWLARHGLTAAQYQTAFDGAVGQGYRLVHVDGHWTTSGVRYAAIWEKNGGGQWVARHGLSSAQYQAAFNSYVGQGYALVHVSGYWDGQQERYAAIWSK
jgi:hypothetical protein